MAIAGLRGTGDWGTDERPKNFREAILWLDPNGQTPLTGLLSKMSTESVDDPEFSWWEESQDLVRVTLGADATAGATTLTLTGGAYGLVKGDLLMRETDDGLGELIELTATPSSDTSISVARGVAGSTAAAYTAADGVVFTKIGNVHPEGGVTPDSTTRNPVKLRNYCQIFKTSYEITKTALKTRARTGDVQKNDKKRKMFDHSRDLEMAFMFGRAYEAVGDNGKPKRYTGGLNSFIQTNRTVFNGDLSEDSFIEAIAPVFNWDGAGAGNERLVFAGNTALMAMNKLAKAGGQVNFDGGVVKVYGMNMARWILPQGTIYVRTHPLMNIHPVFSKAMFVINPRGLKYRPLRDTKAQDDIGPETKDSVLGEWLTEAGLEVHHEKTMAYLGNVTTEQLEEEESNP